MAGPVQLEPSTVQLAAPRASIGSVRVPQVPDARPASTSRSANTTKWWRPLKSPPSHCVYLLDGPEKGQAFGEQSKQNLSALVFQKEVEARCHKNDRYGRELCVLLPFLRDRCFAHRRS